jgi:hypothetical protein
LERRESGDEGLGALEGGKVLVVFMNTINTMTITRNIMTSVCFILHYYQNLFKKSTDESPVRGGGALGLGLGGGASGLGGGALGLGGGVLEQLDPKGHAILVK